MNYELGIYDQLDRERRSIRLNTLNPKLFNGTTLYLWYGTNNCLSNMF